MSKNSANEPKKQMNEPKQQLTLLAVTTQMN